MALNKLVHLLELQVVIGLDGEFLFVPLDAAMRALEVIALGNLPRDILERIIDLGEIGLGNDIEGGH
jgi:hypothetical protein